MTIGVLGTGKLSLVEIGAFLAAWERMRFGGCGCVEIQAWVERLLCHHRNRLQQAAEKGGTISESPEKPSFGAKARIDSAGFMRGLKPRLPPD
jgi:hypothetical protein